MFNFKIKKVENKYLLVKNNRIFGEFYQEVDGFYVYEPPKNSCGFYGEIELEYLLNILKDLNKSHKEEIEDYFEYTY